MILDEPLHIGDRVRIACAQVPQLCVDRTVGFDGTIDVPILGVIAAAVLRPSLLAERIAASLPFDRPPAKIEVLYLGAAVGTIAICGAVERPLRVFAPRGTARDRLLQAASTTPDADLALLGANRRLRSGETLFVPHASPERRISVLGGVESPRILPPTNGLMLASALDAAGGLNAYADRDRIIVVRGGESIPLAMPHDAAFQILPGDALRVELIEVRRFVILKGLVKKPGTIPFAPGMTALAVIKAAGGLLEQAKNGTLVWQTGAKTYRLSLAFLLAGRIPDPQIGAGDTIVIEAGSP